LSSYNIRKGNTVQILFRAYGGFNFYVIKEDFLSPKYDYDFSNLIDDGKVHTRGTVNLMNGQFPIMVLGKILLILSLIKVICLRKEKDSNMEKEFIQLLILI
ncbi:hypothetical protein C1646_681879, partial [Rhizophagus diaphanus]